MKQEEMKPQVIDYLQPFMHALKKQLIEDGQRWGDTWLERPKWDQEYKVFDRLDTYYEEWLEDGIPMPWLKMAGNCMIAWLRENYPDLSPHWK